MARPKITAAQAVDAAKHRVEDAMLELFQHIEGWNDNLSGYHLRNQRKEHLRLTRNYAAAMDRLSRIRQRKARA